VEAAKKQMAALNTNTRYLYHALSEYCEALMAKVPKPLSKVFLVNSGSAATDLAYRLASCHTKQDSFFVLEQGYHGNTARAIELSAYKFDGRGGRGAQRNIIKLPLPDSFRANDSSQNSFEIANDLILNHDHPIAGFIAESIVGCGGQVVLPPGYLHAIYTQIRSSGGVCIADEVQTGFGRTGSHFWAFQQHNVVPDIIILGKPMANGHPIGAVICTDEIAQSFENGMEFFSSFGGNPVSCVIAKAVLDVIKEEQLQTHAATTGTYLIKQFERLQELHPQIGDIRGSGLFLGVEFIKDQHKTPNPELANYIQEKLKEAYILSSLDGPFHNVLKIKPPMCFNKDNADQLILAMDQILKH
jgi:4-aminobutyrate aminotransferase-like enzyme